MALKLSDPHCHLSVVSQACWPYLKVRDGGEFVKKKVFQTYLAMGDPPRADKPGKLLEPLESVS